MWSVRRLAISSEEKDVCKGDLRIGDVSLDKLTGWDVGDTEGVGLRESWRDVLVRLAERKRSRDERSGARREGAGAPSGDTGGRESWVTSGDAPRAGPKIS